MDTVETLEYWTFEAAVQRAIERYRRNDTNENGLPYHASSACSIEALEASWSGEVCLQLIADLLHEGVLSLARNGASEEEIAKKTLAPLLEMGLTLELGPEKQQILNRRYAAATDGMASIAE